MHLSGLYCIQNGTGVQVFEFCLTRQRLILGGLNYETNITGVCMLWSPRLSLFYGGLMLRVSGDSTVLVNFDIIRVILIFS